MSEIPEDVMERAREIGSELDDIHFNSRHPTWEESAVAIIAQALLSERNRALKEAAEVARNGREVRDPLDNFQSTVMRDWEDMDALATAIEDLAP